ncbi:MAG TPA: CdaR family protein, partial [Gemmatimonadales bacterium]|nr:CdaR family protein [Gemmatimonadales bacterium]
MGWIRDWLTKNVGMKLLSLALAAALWAVFGNEPTVEAVFDVPVEFSSVPASFELLAEQTRVQVRARGPSRAVRAAKSQDFSVKIDLAGSSGAGERTYPLNRESIQAPSNIEVLQTVPSRVRLSLEETAVKEIPVHPQFA